VSSSEDLVTHHCRDVCFKHLNDNNIERCQVQSCGAKLTFDEVKNGIYLKRSKSVSDFDVN
jgi:hypothetical protein